MPEQHFSVWLFFNPGDKTLFLLKSFEVRISEWTIRILKICIFIDNFLADPGKASGCFTNTSAIH